MKFFTLFFLGFVMASLSACNSYYSSSQPMRTTYDAPRQSSQLGRVSDIQVLSTQARTSGGGAVLGAVIGGVVGHQVGGGSGKDVATGVGVIGGALAGNEVEKRNKAGGEIYRVTVSLDNGRTQQFDYEHIDDLRVGDRVSISDGQITQL